MSWIHDTLPDFFARSYAIAFDPFDSTRILIGGDSIYSYKLLLVSTDLGNTWTHIGNGLTGPVACITASPTVSGLFYAGTSQGLFRSTDGGYNWTRTGTFTTVRAVVISPEDENLIYAGTATGVYLTTDGGSTWQQINQGLTNINIQSLALRTTVNPAVFAGTNGAGIFTTSPPTAIKEGKSPNNTRGKLTVVVSPLPSRKTVTITAHTNTGQALTGTIYDRSGRMAISLEPKVPAGGKSVWQINTEHLPAGTYLLRLQNGDCVVNRILVVTE